MFFRGPFTSASQFGRYVGIGVLDCFEPEAACSSLQSRIVTIASCFARNVAADMAAAGYDVFTIPVTDRIFTPPALQTFIEKALRDAEPVEALREHWSLDQAQIDEMRKH